MDNKKKVIIYALIAMLVVMVVGSLAVALFYSRIENGIIGLIRVGGYTSILVVALIADLLVQPVGPDVPQVFGIIAGLNPFFCFLMAAAGTFAASLISYNLGKYVGEAGMERTYSKQYQKWKQLFEKHGKMSLLIGAITPIPYVPFCWFSGIFRMKIIDFVIFGILPRVLRSLGVMMITVFILSSV